jgi:uncharacterized protein
MEKILKNKYRTLQHYLQDLGEIVVAYSGGVDSTFLLKVAKDTLRQKARAIIGNSAVIPHEEFQTAIELAKRFGEDPVVIQNQELNSPLFISNPADRCYHCKHIIFNEFLEHVRSLGLKNLADGSNIDDLKDYRPGTKALEEMVVLSPLCETGFTKHDIRLLSKELKLPTWDKEAMACLATRIPYGEEITTEKLAMVEQAEIILRELGFSWVRARLFGKNLRIEVAARQLHLFFDDKMREKIIQEMKKLDFRYITLDMEGYRMGSMND